MPFKDFLPIIGNVVDAVGNNIQSNNARNTAYDLADKQHQYAVADWNANNAYNSPAAQMGRYKDAGLNPNLIYGQMSNAPAIKSPDISNPGQAAPMNFGHGGAAASQNINTSQRNAAEIAQSEAQRKLLDATTFTKQKEGEYYDSMAQATLKNMGGTNQLMQSNTNLNTQKYEQTGSLFPSQMQAAQLHNENTAADTRKKLQEVSSLFTNTELEKIKTANDKARTISMIARNKADMSKIPSEIQLLKWTANSHEAQSMLTNLESDSKRFDLNQLSRSQPTSHDSYISRFFTPLQQFNKRTAIKGNYYQ